MSHGHGHPQRRKVTWVELGVGVGLLALAAGAGTLLFGSKVHASESDTAFRDAQRIREAVVEWRAENPQGCPTLSQLKHERRLDTEVRTDDPWGQRYRVECVDSQISVVSPGRDGRTGTSDDVRVPRNRG